MTGTPNNGGPAFPRPFGYIPSHGIGDGADRSDAQPGMTLRDWFAGQALAGMLANESIRVDLLPSDYAADAYLYADAMLDRRDEVAEGGAS